MHATRGTYSSGINLKYQINRHAWPAAHVGRKFGEKKKKNTLSLYIYFAFGLVPCSCLLLDTMHPLSYYTPPLINE